MYKRFISYILFLFLFLIPGFPGISLFASELSMVDSSKVVVRQPDAKFIDSYRSQKEFNYLGQPLLEKNLFNQLIKYLIDKFKSWKQYSHLIPMIFKMLMWMLILLTFLIIITKTKLYKLFYTDQEIENPAFVFSNPDEQTIDFDEAIRLQINQQQYRLAIRLLYIKGISLLRSKELIHFSKEKTNVDYWCDLTDADLKSGFYRVTSIYNHVWYGDVEIEEDQYLRFEKSFQSFYSSINV